jgi:NTE family protein
MAGGEKQADLVLEGGGVKGVGLIGAISVLEDAGYTFRRIAGTSAGAIIGSFLAAGMRAADLREVITTLDYRKFRQRTALRKVPIVGEPLALWFQRGLYSSSYVHSFVAGHLADHGVRTFADLREDDPDSSLDPKERYRLIVHASDVSRSRLLRLPWDYQSDFGLDPDAQPVADAVRASASIPLFFNPVKQQLTSGRPSWLVDGGMLSNFPLEVFDRTDGQPERWETIGIKLSAEKHPGAVLHQATGLVSLTEAMVTTLTHWYDQAHLDDPKVVARTIFVDTTGYRSTDFSITREAQDHLYENGRAAAAKWLAARSGSGVGT